MMRAGTITAAAWSFLGKNSLIKRQSLIRQERAPAASEEWDPDTFAEEQIRGLVRQAFSPVLNPPVSQVVFSALEHETDIWSLCSWVGDVLAQERPGEIAVVDDTRTMRAETSGAGACWGQHAAKARHKSIRDYATRVHPKLWSVASRDKLTEAGYCATLCAYMEEIRREFEYSIVAAPAWVTSSDAAEMARFADGIVLVVSAKRTRRVTALKAKNSLSHVRLLGTVLSDREFPIPTSIYRRL